MTADGGRVSIGIAGSLGAEAGAKIATAAERAGFHGLWVNDTPGADSVEVLAAAAAVTGHLALGTGVIPVDRRAGAEIAAAVERRQLPVERLTIGIGSGSARHGVLPLICEQVRVLRDATDAQVMIGALGPRMRRLAAEAADGVLLNWMTAGAAADQAAEHHTIDEHGRVALYVRTAMEPAAWKRLAAEAERYGSLPNYAANFTRLHMRPMDTVLPRTPGDGIATGVAAYLSAVDEVVLRAITPTDDVEDYLRFIDAAAAELDAGGSWRTDST